MSLPASNPTPHTPLGLSNHAQQPHQPPIRCVCFDWGGVILKHCRSWAEASSRAGIPLREGMDDPDLIAVRRKINQEFQCGRLSEREFFPAISRATLDIYSPEDVRLVHSAWLIGEYQGVGEVIDALNNRRDIETALLSNTNEAHWKRHLSTGFKPADFPTIGRIKHRHASHLLGSAKPNTEVYRAFEAATGFTGTSILFFDDLPENIATARSLGWRAELIDYTRETRPQLLDKLSLAGVL